MNQVTKEQSPPLVTVCVLAYQHKKYVRQCLDSIVSQKTNFRFEVIVGENESSDGTREICQEYASKYPDLIHLKLHSRKDVILINGSPNGRYNLTQSLLAAQGKYIAICEADDYWTSEHKLQKQVEFLERTGYNSCFTEGNIVDESGNVVTPDYIPYKRDLNQEDIFRYGGHFAMASVLYRKEIFTIDDFWFRLAGGDRYMQAQFSENSKIGYVPDNMVAYRRHGAGLWSGKSEFTKSLNIYRDFRIYMTIQKYCTRYSNIFRIKLADNLATMTRYCATEWKIGRHFIYGLKYMQYMPWTKYYFKLLISSVIFPRTYNLIKGKPKK